MKKPPQTDGTEHNSPPPDIDGAKAVAGRLRELRIATDETQAAVAARLGVHFQTYRNYESGERSIPLPLLLRIISEFRVAPAWLLTGTGPQCSQCVRDAVERSAATLRAAVMSSPTSAALAPEKQDKILAELVMRELSGFKTTDAQWLIRLATEE